MDFRFTDEQNALRDTVRKLLDRVATPGYIRRLDREQDYPYELFDAMRDIGLFAVPFPEEYGGLGGGVVEMVIIGEELGRKSYDFFASYVSTCFNGMNLVKNATDAQKDAWIPKLIRGEVRMSISMSEPGAGSDFGALRTTARRDGGHYVVNGQKLWSSGAGARDNVINLYAKSGSDPDYRKNVSLLLVDNDAPGVTLRKIDTLGRRCVGTYEVFFDEVRVPADRLIGGENRGWQCMLSGLQYERAIAVSAYVGSAQAVVDLALDYAKERRQFGQPIGHFQAIGHMLADMQTEVEAARALMWRAAWLADAGQDALKEITMAKLFASETLVKVANQGMQVFGAAGYTMEYDMQRYFRDARSATIGGGTSQMQRNLIARLMGLRPESGAGRGA